MSDFDKAIAIFQNLSVQELDEMAELQKTMDPEDLQRAMLAARNVLDATGKHGPLNLEWEAVATIMSLATKQHRDLASASTDELFATGMHPIERLVALLQRAYPLLRPQYEGIGPQIAQRKQELTQS